MVRTRLAVPASEALPDVVSATAGDSALAAQLIEMLAGEASRAWRLAGGFTF